MARSKHTLVLFFLLALVVSGFLQLRAKAFDNDTHFTMKIDLLRLAGFSNVDAETIAKADASVDEGDTKAGIGDPSNPESNNKKWHAMGSPEENAARKDNLTKRAMDQIDKFKQTQDPKDRELALIYYGQLLHFVEDIYSHQGHDYVVWIQVDFFPPFFIDVGHGIECYWPDHLSNHLQTEIDAMVIECINSMATFFTALTGQPSNPPQNLALNIGRYRWNQDDQMPVWKRPFVPPKNDYLPKLYKYDKNGIPISFAPAQKFRLTDYLWTIFDSIISNITYIIPGSPSFPDHPEAGTALTLLTDFANEMKYLDFPIYDLGYAVGNLTGLSSVDDGVMNCTIALSLMMSNLVEMRDSNAWYVASLSNETENEDFNASLNQAYDEKEKAWAEIQKMETTPHDVDFTNLASSLTNSWGYLRDAEQIALLLHAEATDWPMFRYDLINTGFYPNPGPTQNFTIWSFTTAGTLTSSPAVVDGVLYIGSSDFNVYALDASTGQKIWNYTTNGVVYSSPAVADGVVFVGSNDTKVYALDASTGTQIWNYTTYWGVWSSPAVSDGVVYVGGMDGLMYALDESTGALKWATWLGVSMSSSPAVVGDTVYIGGLSADFSGNVTALYASNGTIKWVYPLVFGPYFSSPAVVDDTLYIGTTGFTVLALNATTGTFKWSYFTGNVVNTSPAVADGMVYAGSADKKIYALNATTGAKIWDYTTGGAVYCSPAVAGNGMVYVGSDDLTLYAFNAKTEQRIWKYVTGGWLHGSVVLAQNYVYLGAHDGKVRAIGAPAIVGDMNNDGTVDIYDAIILANAFYSTPSSRNWNANADLNGDGIVDIYDAILLSNNFGK